MTNRESPSNGIWIGEYEHASRLVLAARRERSWNVAVYLLLVGSAGTLTAVAPLFVFGGASALAVAPNPLLYLALAMVGVFTLVRLVRTRHAESDGLRAMARLRDHAVKSDPGIAGLLGCISEHATAPGRAWSVALDQILLVMILDSGAFGVAAQASGLRVPLGEYVVGIFAAVIFLAWQVLYYLYQLPAEA